VVATIHQPNSLITDHFDNWALLAKGRLLYAGPWGAALPYFEGAGHTCPLYRNPTDFFMSLASNSATLAALADAWAQQQVGAGREARGHRRDRKILDCISQLAMLAALADAWAQQQVRLPQ
jgi:hypothetical protein